MKADYDELSPQGRAQATALGEHFAAAGYHFDAVYTGPARRHRDTAALVAEAVRATGRPWPDATELPDFDEHDAFALLRAGTALAHEPEIAEGQAALLAARTPAERSRSFQRLFEALMTRWMQGRFTPDGVETWPRFRERVLAGLEHIIRGGQAGQARALAFSSVGPLAVLLQRALHTDDAASFRTAWRLRNASLTAFVFDDRGRFSLDGFNALPHLPDPRTWTFR